jgi:5-methylcytosine-specific restriction enzyme subunit McrC
VIAVEPLRAWERQERMLPPEVAAAVSATEAVRVTALEPPTRWCLETNSKIGVIVGDGWELRIRPRLAVPRLFFLLAYSRSTTGWRETVAAFSEHDDVLEALASGFATHAERAVEQGLLRGYVAIDERRNEFRGRVRFADQLARSTGLPLPIEVTYDEFTADIPENQLLRTAAEVALALPKVPARARARLLRLRAVLDEVSVHPRPRALELPRITRLNRRYEPALVLGKLILDGVSLNQWSGGVLATSFLFDMNEVFESFLFATLADSLRRHGGTVARQVQGTSLDVGDGLPLKPDIVWTRDGRVRAVVDSKYKSLSAGSSIPNADAYQMLAYCIGFGLRRGVLVYARDSGARTRRHQIRRHGYEIDVEAVDVEKEPDEVLEQIDAIADRLASAAVGPVGAAA